MQNSQDILLLIRFLNAVEDKDTGQHNSVLWVHMLLFPILTFEGLSRSNTLHDVEGLTRSGILCVHS